MPADKLVLLSRNLRSEFERLVKQEGRPKGNYAHFLDLQRTKFELPARIYCGGSFNGANKVEFVRVASLGLSLAEKIVRDICGNLSPIICRLDWALDLLGQNPWDLSARCLVSNVQSSRFYRSRGCPTFYPHFSRNRVVLIYDRAKRLRQKRDPLARVFRVQDSLTRVEIQFRGRGVPIREFANIRHYGHINLLEGIGFVNLLQVRSNLKPMQLLAAERLQSLVREFGLQNAFRRFSPSESAYLSAKLLAPASNIVFPDIRSLMQKSAQDWLEDRIRFPRA